MVSSLSLIRRRVQIFKKKINKKREKRRHVLAIQYLQCEARAWTRRKRRRSRDQMRERDREKKRKVKKWNRYKVNRKARLTPFLYGASSIASTSKSSAITRVGELSETPRISRPQSFTLLADKRREIRELWTVLGTELSATSYNVQTTSARNQSELRPRLTQKLFVTRQRQRAEDPRQDGRYRIWWTFHFRS